VREQSRRTVGKVTGSSLNEGSAELHACLMLDSLGERYGMLPSQVLAQANTLDIWVFDVAISFREAQDAKAQGKAPKASQDQLKQMMENARGNQN
jgi:hypothetical protein